MFFISKYGGGLGYAGYLFHISGLRSRASLSRPPHCRLPPAAPLGADFLTPLTNCSGIRSSRCPVRAEGITTRPDSRRANVTARSGRGEFWGHVASWRPDSESRMGTPRDARGAGLVMPGDRAVRKQTGDAQQRGGVKVKSRGHGGSWNCWREHVRASRGGGLGNVQPCAHPEGRDCLRGALWADSGGSG